MTSLLTRSCSSVAALAGMAAIAMSVPCALAQSAPAPVGIWDSDAGETMVVGQTCKIEANGMVGAIGSCSWNPSSDGGILTIMNVNAYQPAPVYFSIVWIDESAFSISGDVFHRRQ
ncbi:hypothetical protein [Mesorhizobium sp. 113-3-9]|uniref:hypothetical protein n=1 Tax=Mesorhizobium sp. 113-3-9 TaxID=2744517 RepID=UPI0019292034|nr:hypothetical protein [Mesorhizobium sp. 113-3-9]